MMLDLIIENQIAPPWTNTILGPLIGAFVGVGLGVCVNEKLRRKLASERKLFFRNLLLHEIRTAIDVLNHVAGWEKTTLIPVDGWDSLVNSGNITLFTDEAIELSTAYFLIKDFNWGYDTSEIRTNLLQRLRMVESALNEKEIIIKADEAGAYNEYKG